MILNLIKTKRNTEYKIARGRLRQHFTKWSMDLEASKFFFVGLNDNIL